MLAKFIIIAALFILSSMPLYLLIKLLGGKTSLLKTAFISFIAGLVIGAVKEAFAFWGGLLAFLVLIWIYHEAFRLRWWKAFLLWLLQGILVGVLYAVAALLFIGSLLF